MKFTLPAKTVVKIEGLCVTLEQETPILTTEANWRVIQDLRRERRQGVQAMKVNSPPLDLDL